MALSDGEILSTVQAILSSGEVEGELQTERAEALDRYFGKPYGNEVPGRSSVVARDTLETVEWMLPSLMRLFADADNIVEIDPVGPDDEEQAAQESDAVWHVFWKQNNGFLNTYSACKDALLSKTGILKVWWDDSADESREEHSGLTADQVSAILNDDPSIERELIEFEMDENGLFSIAVRSVRSRGRICVETVPPEEFGVHIGARSPRAKDALACWQRRRMTASELVEMGVPADVVKTLPSADAEGDEEDNARRRTDDEDETGHDVLHESSREIWVTETYTYIDRNEDGIAELLKVLTAGTSSDQGAGVALVSGDGFEGIEEVDRIPFCTTTPYITPHRFYGQSVYDLVGDLEEINTALTRGALDNLYLSNNPERVADEDHVEIQDLMTPRPGNIVRATGDGQPVSNFVSVLGHTPLPPQTFEMMDRVDQQRKQRTGVGDEVAGLDKAALSNINTGVAALAFDAARGKVELIARIFAETMFRDVFLDIRELLSKHIDRPMAMRLRGQWTEVVPNTWRNRTETTIRVGIGQVSRERRLQALEQVMEKQALVVQSGGIGTLLMPENIYSTLRDYTEAWGLEPDTYWTDPASIPPRPPEGPTPEQELAVAQLSLVKEQNQIALFRAQAEAQAKERDSQLKAQEMQLRAELDRVKAGMSALEADGKRENDARKLALEAEKMGIERRLSEIEIDSKSASEDLKAQIDVYEANLKATVELMKQSATQGTQASESVMQALTNVANTLASMVDQVSAAEQRRAEESAATVARLEALARPKKVVPVFDEEGNLVGAEQVVEE